MVTTRSRTVQGAGGQPPSVLASRGDGVAYRPTAHHDSLQGNADVTRNNPNLGSHELGGAHISVAFGKSAARSTPFAGGLCKVDLDHSILCRSATCRENTVIQPCGSQGCHTCPELDTNVTFKCTNTGLIYPTIDHEDTIPIITCKSTNLIYLLTCNNCKMQYVGETADKKFLQSRMGAHRRCANPELTNLGCRYVNEHFTEGDCRGAKFTINVIEQFQGNGRVDGDFNRALDPKITKARREVEHFWIAEMRTIYPYGLNINYKNELFNRENISNHVAYTQFHSVNKVHNNRKRGRRHSKALSKSKNNEKFVTRITSLLKDMINLKLPQVYIEARKLIFQQPKCVIRSVYDKFATFVSSLTDICSVHKYDLIIDLIKSQLHKPSIKTKINKKKGNGLYAKVFFHNKGIEMVNLPRILHLSEVIHTLPFRSTTINRKDYIPTVTYTYQKPIRTDVLNYISTLKNANIDEFMNNDISSCDCHLSPFKDSYHQHVITGDLSIIDNHRLRNLLEKGLNYREYCPVNWAKTYQYIRNGIHNMIKNWSDKSNLALQKFSHYEQSILKHVKSQIDFCKSKYGQKVNTNFIPVLKDQSVIKELNIIHDKYVLTSVDKANNNVAIICKKFYLQTIYNELYAVNETSEGLFGNIFDEHKVYEESHLTESQAVNIHHSYMKSINMPCDWEKYNSLPYIYMMPKFHKTPIKFRYIVGSKTCSSKPLSNALSKTLKVISTSRMYYCKKLQTYDGINRFWVINNNAPILECIDKLNNSENAKSINTYDFSNLYTSLPHNDIMHSMKTIITKLFAFKAVSEYNYIVVYPSNKANTLWSMAAWSKNPNKSTFRFNVNTLIESLDFQLNTTFFTFGQRVFQQMVGVPMGTDMGPEIANLHLHQCEFSYLNNLKKHNTHQARLYNDTYRYLDDITIINGNDLITINMHNIYGTVLLLNKENVEPLNANVLDLTISIDQSNKTMDCKLYDKRRDYSFKISNMPDLTGNIPTRNSYGVVTGELLRYAKINTRFDNFQYNAIKLMTLLISQGYDKSKLQDRLEKFVSKYKHCMSKYNCTKSYIVNNVMGNIPSNDGTVTGRP